MQEDFINYLLGSAGLAALVSDRVYWIERPQGDPFPSIVLTVISDNQGYRLRGRDGLSKARIQVDIYADTYADSLMIEKQIGHIFDPVKFSHGSTSFTIFEDFRREGRETSTPDTDRPFRISTDFSLTYKEK